MEEKDLIEFFELNDKIIEVIERRLTPSAHPLHLISMPRFTCSDQWDPPMPPLIGEHGAQWDCTLCGAWTGYQDSHWVHFQDKPECKHTYHLCPQCQNLLIKNGKDILGRAVDRESAA